MAEEEVQQSSSKKWIWILVGVVIIVLLSVTSFWIFHKPVSINKPNLIDCKNDPAWQGLEKECLVLNALKQKEKIDLSTFNHNQCTNLTRGVQLTCLKEFALLEKDPRVCQQLNEITTSSASADYCLRDLAVETNDSSICNEINSTLTQRECFLTIAININDEGLCPINGSVTYSYDYCVATIAVSKQDTSICDKIVKDEAWWTQKNMCYEKIAYLTKDSTICDKIFGANLISDCKRNVGLDRNPI